MCKCVKTAYTDITSYGSNKQKKQKDQIKWVFMQKEEIGFCVQETEHLQVPASPSKWTYNNI